MATTINVEKNVKPMYIDAKLPNVKNMGHGASNNEIIHNFHN
jgi:hypothetical protein